MALKHKNILFLTAIVAAVFFSAACYARGFRLYRASGSSTLAETLSQTAIDVHEVDSEETTAADNDADNVLDGNSSTIWHTKWYSNNVVTNGTFETDTAGWSIQTNSSATLSATAPGQGGSAKAARVNISNFVSYVRAFSPNISLQPQTEYQLIFNAYCSTGHGVEVSVFKRTTPYTNYGLLDTDLNLTTGWQQYIVPFTSTNTATVTDARIRFNFSEACASGDIYYIDNVVLAEVGSTDNTQPHEIQLDLTETRSVIGLKYLPRQDASSNGLIDDYEIYVSDDPESWGTAVATGTWANDKTEKTVTFTATDGRYVRLRSTSEVNGGPWASAAELNVLIASSDDFVFTYGSEHAVATADFDATTLDYTHDGSNGEVCFVLTAYGYSILSEQETESAPSNQVCEDLENEETYTFEWNEYPFPSHIAPSVVSVIDYPLGNEEIDLAVKTTVRLEGSAYNGIAPYTYAWSFGGMFSAWEIGEYPIGATKTNGGYAWRVTAASTEEEPTGTPEDWVRIDNIGNPCPEDAQCTIDSEGIFLVSLLCTDSVEQTDTTPIIKYTSIYNAPDTPINRSDWTIAYVDSEETVQADNGASNIIDGDVETIWHTLWSVTPTCPHEIIIDMDASDDTADYAINKVKFWPRHGIPSNGRPSMWELYLLADDSCGDDLDFSDCEWGMAAATGSWSNTQDVKEINLTGSPTARYLRFVVLASYGTTYDTWASGAEIQAYGTLSSIAPRLLQFRLVNSDGYLFRYDSPYLNYFQGNYLYLAAIFSKSVDVSNTPTLTVTFDNNVTLGFTPVENPPYGFGNGSAQILFKSNTPLKRTHETDDLTVSAITGTYTASDDGVTTSNPSPPNLPTGANLGDLYNITVTNHPVRYLISYSSLGELLDSVGFLRITDNFSGWSYKSLNETYTIDLSSYDGTADARYNFTDIIKWTTAGDGIAFGDYTTLEADEVVGNISMGSYGIINVNKIYGDVTIGSYGTMMGVKFSGTLTIGANSVLTRCGQ